MTERRVSFDFEVDFSNGGGIQGQGFRLDIEGEDIADDALATAIIEDMRLLMVGEVRILNKEIIEERHKRGGAVADEAGEETPDQSFIDLSHTIKDGMITYKGLPAPLICDHISFLDSHDHYAEGTEFQIGKIEMVANTGTYIDTPAHRYRDGHDLEGLMLEKVSNLPGLVVRVSGAQDRAIDWQAFAASDVSGRAVLVETGWDRHWGSDQYFEGHPFLTEAAAVYLRDQGATIVGIDSLNIDDTSGGTRPVHSVLLKAEIPIVEHMTNLAALPVEGFRFFAAPPKVRGMGTFPVRAHARLESD
ncbi:cyclase family protein [Denitrobaculum tricleocarpae]|uniref:Cyclase family protein n=1 Tax=Denitrobaculum tricleocarpae TaxID=2591009 RepID=A0A545T5C5_9PROT|nr:cyclase family protein [Denitrobaculum tricleocarpae]TQV72450.1 cyclase family protein [Denitrobaculum tricleocarpae]